MKWLVVFVSFAAVCCLVSISIADQLELEFQKLLPPPVTSTQDRLFGSDIAIDDGYLIVSGPRLGNRGGESFVYSNNSGFWEYETRFMAPTSNPPNLYFGSRVSISHDVNTDSTRVLLSRSEGGLVYEKGSTGWILAAELPQWGTIQDDTAFLYGGNKSALVYGKENEIWSFKNTISSNDPRDFNLSGSLGRKFILEGDVAFAPLSGSFDSGFNGSGGVIGYERVNGVWQESEVIVPVDPVWNGKFGYDIDFDGNTLIVGRPAGGPAADGPFEGLAYIYENIGGDWTETTRLRASDGFNGNGFGADVAISGSLAAVLSEQYEQSRVYLFRKVGNTWNELGWLGTGLPYPQDQFGVTVELDGHTLVIGARLDNDAGNRAGAVYIYTIPEPSSWSLFIVVAITLGMVPTGRFV